jgi:hypothetical protein
MLLSGTISGSNGACAFFYGKYSGKYQGMDKRQRRGIGLPSGQGRHQLAPSQCTLSKRGIAAHLLRIDRVDDIATVESIVGCDLG